MKCTIRLARMDDVPAMLDIYAPYVRETDVSFEYDVPDLQVFEERFSKFSKHCPWLVCEFDGTIAGYAYAHPFHERAAYKWTAECSIYVDGNCHGRGVGKALYTCLLGTLKMQGYFTAFAGVTVPNAKSEALHASLGFERVGTFKKIGYKNGNWLNVAFFELQFGNYTDKPRQPKAIWEVSDSSEFFSLLQKAASMVKPAQPI